MDSETAPKKSPMRFVDTKSNPPNLDPSHAFHYANGDRVQEIITFSDPVQIRGMWVKFASGAAMRAGVMIGSRDIHELGPNEAVRGARIWSSDYKGGRCTGFQLETSEGNTLQFGNIGERRVEVQGGILGGLFGAAGNAIEGLGLVYLDEPTEFALANAAYDFSRISAVMKPRYLDRVCFVNNKSQPVKIATKQSLVFTTTEKFDTSWAFKLGLAAKFRTGVPFLAGAEWQTSAEISKATSYGKSASETHVVEASTPDYELQPGETVVVYFTVSQGIVTVPYKATLTTTYASGSVVPGLDDVGVFTGLVGTDIDVVIGGPVPASAKDRDLGEGTHQRRVAEDPHSLEEETVVVYKS